MNKEIAALTLLDNNVVYVFLDHITHIQVGLEETYICFGTNQHISVKEPAVEILHGVHNVKR
jgi:hypothetical protein